MDLDDLDTYAAWPLRRLSGDELITLQGAPTSWTVLSFWQWAFSDLASNTVRGILAEFLVRCALGIDQGVRVQWDATDLRTTSGLKVEVRSAAYLQSWSQGAPSSVSFKIAQTRRWDAATNTYLSEPDRHSDVYVFALLKHRNKSTLNPLNIDQWSFYVISTRILNRLVPNQRSVTLSKLASLGALQVPFSGLAGSIERAGRLR